MAFYFSLYAFLCERCNLADFEFKIRSVLAGLEVDSFLLSVVLWVSVFLKSEAARAWPKKKTLLYPYVSLLITIWKVLGTSLFRGTVLRVRGAFWKFLRTSRWETFMILPRLLALIRCVGIILAQCTGIRTHRTNGTSHKHVLCLQVIIIIIILITIINYSVGRSVGPPVGQSVNLWAGRSVDHWVGRPTRLADG